MTPLGRFYRAIIRRTAKIHERTSDALRAIGQGSRTNNPFGVQQAIKAADNVRVPGWGHPPRFTSTIRKLQGGDYLKAHGGVAPFYRPYLPERVERNAGWALKGAAYTLGKPTEYGSSWYGRSYHATTAGRAFKVGWLRAQSKVKAKQFARVQQKLVKRAHGPVSPDRATGIRMATQPERQHAAFLAKMREFRTADVGGQTRRGAKADYALFWPKTPVKAKTYSAAVDDSLNFIEDMPTGEALQFKGLRHGGWKTGKGGLVPRFANPGRRAPARWERTARTPHVPQQRRLFPKNQLRLNKPGKIEAKFPLADDSLNFTFDMPTGARRPRGVGKRPASRGGLRRRYGP